MTTTVPPRQRTRPSAQAPRSSARGADEANPPAPAPSFASVLWPPGPELEAHSVPGWEPVSDPLYFADLHLDDILRSVIAGRDPYDLAPFFRQRTLDEATVRYRHEVFRDLEDPEVVDALRGAGVEMLLARQRLVPARKGYYRYERERWFLDSAATYRGAVATLAEALARLHLDSAALRGFAAYLADYFASPAYETLSGDIRARLDELAEIRYRLHLEGPRVTVGHVDEGPDYGAQVLATFEKFRQGGDKEYHFADSDSFGMNHVEAAVLERVALLFPSQFAALDAFCHRHAEFFDPVIERFDREIQFYLAYVEHMARLRSGGLSFCHPEVGPSPTPLRAIETFDLALATILRRDGSPVVTNDIDLSDGERIIVVSGPNQGGKTTTARTIGQLHHLAAIGVPVPGTAARIQLVDDVFTIFERAEVVEDLAGKLEDDLRRVYGMFRRATSASLLIMNESFSSTTLGDQLAINQEVLREVLRRGSICVVVTFLDELVALDPTIVSLVSSVDPDEPATRTFKVVRRPPDGLAYAMAIAEKHGLTYARISERLAR